MSRCNTSGGRYWPDSQYYITDSYEQWPDVIIWRRLQALLYDLKWSSSSGLLVRMLWYSRCIPKPALCILGIEARSSSTDQFLTLCPKSTIFAWSRCKSAKSSGLERCAYFAGPGFISSPVEYCSFAASCRLRQAACSSVPLGAHTRLPFIIEGRRCVCVQMHSSQKP